MTSKQIGPFAQAWYKWKALRLPWRRRFLIGFDLKGNTFWEFRNTRGTKESGERWRRIVSYPRSTHYSEVKVSPQWHQWLRHTRRDPPTLEEQHEEVARQERMKYLAAEADARWEAKPRVMEAPREEQEKLPLAKERAPADEASAASPQTKKTEKADENDPWARAKAQGPGEKWQPTAWNPAATKRNR
ncbi:NADH ubiquinone oxidoreductase subunit NDUFA12 domain-containing protein [Trichoderma breve]|uniref:NADH ubiquinone oxidoreductase subunit NDUFA12 domain-containing protein n=1 Tax=Trichoderma breve TaxID=2034170 RepID=A0A9W9B953_9HYPO|nr:NADH ubiquinone oxidoreductase subunit NDUFA12 domain-containing protein [Trichoderma breve]KAJ4858927.1 NADH ubiquinone oxidoreductase subunit NDUFA12 domain-containing protein [Trichoderma breve]